MVCQVSGGMLQQFNDDNQIRSTEQEIDYEEEKRYDEFVRNEKNAQKYSIEYIETNDNNKDDD